MPNKEVVFKRNKDNRYTKCRGKIGYNYNYKFEFKYLLQNLILGEVLVV